MSPASQAPTINASRGCPSESQRLTAYVRAFDETDSVHLISNVRTRVSLLNAGEVSLPLTVNEAEDGNSYVCSPHTLYALYAKEEMRLIPSRWARWPLRGVANVVGAALKAAQIDRMVQVNNWMLSTNLYPAGSGVNARRVTDELVGRHPHHFICFRSLNRWANPGLLQELVGLGYKLVASRQVYVFDQSAAAPTRCGVSRGCPHLERVCRWAGSS